MDTTIEGYFHIAVCRKCNTRFYPLYLKTNADGKIALISNRELYCTVGDLTSDEQLNNTDSQRIAERISLQKMRRDLVHCRITKFVLKETQRYSPGFEPGIYYHCIHCDEAFVKSSGEISFPEYLEMGGKIDFNYALPGDAENKWKLLRNYGITFLIGAFLLSLVWRTTGWIGGVIGGLGILLMLLSVILFNGWSQTFLKHKDEDDRNPFNPEPLPDLGKQYDNQVVTRRIKWISGLVACSGFSLLLLDQKYIHLSRFPSLYYPMFAISFFAIIIWGSAQEKGANYDLGWLWKNDLRLRAQMWLSGAGMVFGMLAVSPFAKSSLRNDWEWIPGTVLFFASAATLVVLISRKMKKTTGGYRNWNTNQKNLDKVFIVLPLGCFMLMSVLSAVLMDNLVTAWNSSNYKTVKLIKRDDHKIPIKVEYGGRVIGLYPGNKGWKAIAGADSVKLRVGTGALGFEHVLEVTGNK